MSEGELLSFVNDSFFIFLLDLLQFSLSNVAFCRPPFHFNFTCDATLLTYPLSLMSYLLSVFSACESLLAKRLKSSKRPLNVKTKRKL